MKLFWIIFERQGPEKGTFLFLLSLVATFQKKLGVRRDQVWIEAFSICSPLFSTLADEGDVDIDGVTSEPNSDQI